MTGPPSKEGLPADMAEADFARLDAAQFPVFSPGTVWLVGAGPGAAGLLTLIGYHALINADVVIYDALVGKQTLDWARSDAEIEYAGKRGGKPSANQGDISLRLIALARAGKRVLRLKGGDPFIFGRGGEEGQMLARAGVPFRIVPGISAGVGGLAYAGIPATHRDINHSVMFLTGHDSTGEVPAGVDWRAVAQATPVLVIYMAVKNLKMIADRLTAHGRPAEDPVTVVARATLPEQEVVETTLGDILEMDSTEHLPTPSVVVVGRASALRPLLDWYSESLRENPIG